MEFCFKLGFTLLVIWVFLFVPYQLVKDFYGHIFHENQLVVWKYRLGMNIVGLLSGIFMLLGAIFAIWG